MIFFSLFNLAKNILAMKKIDRFGERGRKSGKHSFLEFWSAEPVAGASNVKDLFLMKCIVFWIIYVK